MDIPSNIVSGSPAVRPAPRQPSPDAGSRIPAAESGAAQAANAALQAAVTGSAKSDGADLSDKRRERSPDELAEAVKNANDFFQMAKRTLQFTRYEDTDEIVFQVTDAETGTVVRQIPSEEMLALARRLDELHGLLFKEKV